jgi:hypothetical protein
VGDEGLKKRKLYYKDLMESIVNSSSERRNIVENGAQFFVNP